MKIGTLTIADRDHHLVRARPEQRHDPDRHQEAGNGEHDVDEPHQHAVDPAAEEAGDSLRVTMPIDSPTDTETIPMSNESRAP